MELEKIRINFDSEIGWTCAISILNEEGSLRGSGFDMISWEKARWDAIKDAFIGQSREIGEYRGGTSTDIMSSTQLLLYELGNLKPG